MNTQIRIMRLSASGLPLNWVSWQQAAVLYVKDQVLWSLGDAPMRINGGTNRQGQRSFLMLDPIIACSAESRGYCFTPTLNNRLLFRRDGYLCMYCGSRFAASQLTCDHIIPRVHGGEDRWTNVVAACARCNSHKGGRTPQQAGMELLAVPFEPNVFEFMYLANRQIRGDQMAYLQARFTGQRTWGSAS